MRSASKPKDAVTLRQTANSGTPLCEMHYCTPHYGVESQHWRQASKEVNIESFVLRRNNTSSCLLTDTRQNVFWRGKKELRNLTRALLWKDCAFKNNASTEAMIPPRSVTLKVSNKAPKLKELDCRKTFRHRSFLVWNPPQYYLRSTAHRSLVSVSGTQLIVGDESFMRSGAGREPRGVQAC